LEFFIPAASRNLEETRGENSGLDGLRNKNI
jgi:hypothetical protein